MATKKFKCTVCGYIHEGDAAPEKCPVCMAPSILMLYMDSRVIKRSMGKASP